MKKTYKIASLLKWRVLTLALSLLLVSCNAFLDITPDGQVKRDELLLTPEGIEDAIYGTYAQLRQSSLYGAELTIHGMEILAQNMDCYGSDNVEALGSYQWTHSSVLSWASSVWTDMYDNIKNANSVLDGELLKNPQAFPYTVFRGEALALRAFMHFDLVRLFCTNYSADADGIPYQCSFSLNTPEFEKLGKTYQRIIADLREADELLKDESLLEGSKLTFANDRQTHLNRSAVEALLARVYLTKGDKDSAFYYANQVIEQSPYKLKEKTEIIDDMAGWLSQKECLFGVYQSDFYSTVSTLLQQQTSYTSLDPRDDFISLYNDGMAGDDYRYSAYFTAVETGGETHYRLSKFTDPFELKNVASSRPSHYITGINLIRIPEMYYICCECLLDTDPAAALGYFNAVITHRGLDAISDVSLLTLAMLNNERQKEFFGEGQAFFNFKRQGMSILSSDGSVLYSPSTLPDMYVVPLPEAEIINRY